MAIDPYRILGLRPGATSAEVKAAYRRLAKVNHPDAAGEAAIPRFLAIQSAYEMIIGRRPDDRGSRATRAGGAGPAWQADPGRAGATREAGRSRGTRSSGAPGRTRSEPGAERPRGPSADGARQPRSGGTADGPRRPRGRGTRKATLGSTSYDEVDREPFDPEWSGASWYGMGSGTYWTLNPKEYADPRKHGPEYQARARRGAPRSESFSSAADPDPPSGDGGTGAPPDAPASADAAWSDATATDAGQPRWSARSTGEDPTARHEPTIDLRGDGPPAAMATIVARLLDPPHSPPDRAFLALLGWPPIGLALAMIVGESTGCGRFAATCSESAATTSTVGILIGQLVIIGLLALAPRLAALAAGGTIALLVAAVPAAALLSLAGGSREPVVAGRVLIEVLTVAWIIGVGLAVRRRLAGLGVPRTMRP